MYLLVWIGLFAVNIAMIEGNGCSKPLSISNGHYKFISSPDWPQTICRVQYSCDLGYKMNGTGLRFCFHSHWVGKIPVCKEVTCNQLDAPANGSMEFVDNQAPANQMDSIVQFSCEDGYQLEGEVALVCLPDGQWSALPPTCASDQCDETKACELNPCQNNGTCQNNGNKVAGYTCNCVTGFTGDDCSIVPRLCSDIPSGRSGNYQIQPADDIQPFQVHCNFDTSPPSTEIGHDSEDEILVDGYGPQLSYTRNVVYQLSKQQIEAVTNAATTCKQHINYKCYGSVLMYSQSPGTPYAAWYNKDHQQMSYWGGTTTPWSCACGDTGTCADSWRCNCDKNDPTWREDGGFIVDKTQLPVTIMKFGDTGVGSQQGKHKLGKLVCV